MSLSELEVWELVHGFELSQNPAYQLEQKGWREWYAEIFGRDFIDAFGEGHHAEALEWHWESRMSFIRGEQPEYLAYFPIWPRGNGKTTLLRALILCDACLMHTAGLGSYALIVGGTKKKAKGTAVTVSQMLTLPKIKEYYPALSRVQKTDAGQSQGWTADFIYTEANAVFNFIGLDEGVAGANVADIRPTLIAPDDIDDREDSPVISETRFQTFTRAVLPTRQHNTLVFFAQNLISRYSTMYRIHKQYARVLVNRKPTNPVPAVVGLETEERTVNGIIKDVVVAGEPTWKVWTKQRIQDEIDTYGLEAFKRECQHEVEESNEGLVLYNYNDNVHVITESEFTAVYGETFPKQWYKYPFNDWARTKTARHANVAGYYTVSDQNTKLPGMTFLFYPMSFQAKSEPEDVAERLLSVLGDPEGTTWSDLRRDALVRANALVHTTTARDRIEFERSHLKTIIPRYSRPVLREWNVKPGVMSHERDDVRQIYNQIFGLVMSGVNPGKFGGIDKMNRLMRVDYNEPHPFRPEQNGYTRFFIVVPDHKRQYNDAIRPDDLHDWDLVRYQFKNWRHRDPVLTATGEAVDDILKMNDDFGNASQMIFSGNILQARKLTDVEMVYESMPEDIKEPETVNQMQAKASYLNARFRELEAKKKERSRGDVLDGFRRW